MNKRIQRKREKGWKLSEESSNPNGVVYIGRPTKWGNPYKVGDRYKNVFNEKGEYEEMGILAVLTCYKYWLKAQIEINPNFLDELKGKDLACWCRTDQGCHGDILLEFLEVNK